MNTICLQAGFRALGWLAAGCVLAAVARADDGQRKAGDKCSTAFQLNGPLPISANGTTVGFSNDYDEACPYGDSTAPDVVYRYTPASTVTADVLLCTGITDFDTKLYVYESLCPPDGGPPIACNDDACVSSDTGQGFVSALWNVPLQAGTTYYIVVDGYGSAAGNYTLTLRASYPEPTCPMGTAFAQGPGLENWTLAFSDYGSTWWPGTTRYENFCDVASQITGIRFWGLGFHYQWFPPPGTFMPPYWEPCIENPLTFDIRFYADAGGIPGNQVVAYSLSLPGTLVGQVGYAQYELYEYTAQFDVPLALPAGWVSIVGSGDPDCWFAWMSSTEGDGLSFSVTNDPHNPETVEHLDLALCLATDGVPIYGACCDDLPGTCSDNVLAADCAGRFLAGGACGDLTPPCGEVTGACYTGEDCRISTQRDCQRTCPGDMNCDRVVHLADINPFVLALTNPAAYALEFPTCALLNADCDGNGTVGLEDINPFISLVGTVCTTWDSWAGPDSPCMPWCDVSSPWCTIYSSDLPYASTRTTCDRENYFDQTCLGPYDGGLDTLYALVVTDPVELEITLDPMFTYYTGLLLSDHFPPDQDCLASITSPIAAPYSLGCQHLEPGTYYIMIDASPSPECIYMYDLTISACAPAGLGRCCYDNGAQCADTTEDECASLGGVWDAAQNCTAPCPSRFREDCANAETISSVPFDAAFYTDAMTADGPAAPCDKYGPAGALQNDAWFVWTADVSGLAVATALGAYDAVLVVRTDCTNPLYCADHAGSGSEEILRFNVTAGTTYYFQLGTAGNHTGGGWTSFSLHIATNTGACCEPAGACVIMEGTECIYQGGNYQGNGTSCTTDICPAVPGTECASPLVVTLTVDSLPFVDYNYTTGRGDDYSSTCLGSYDSGEDVIYELAVMETVVVNITLDPAGASYTGFALADQCPPTDCIAKHINTTGSPYSVKYVVLRPGLYYLMVDNWLTPSDIPTYTLTIENADTDLGACCTLSGCIGSMQLAQCLDAQGAWHRGQPCNSSTCQTEPGDSCLDPLVIELTPSMYYQGWDSTQYRANTYAGTTCLGLYDGGKEIIYQLVVSDTDVCVSIVLGEYYGFPPVHMVLSTSCPPTDSCRAVSDYWYGVQAIREIVLTPGVYYLMIDVWPQYPWGGPWQDYADFGFWIESCP